jgi:hypothetical protein
MLAVGGVDKANTEFFGVIHRLLKSLGGMRRLHLGLNDGEMAVVAVQQVVDKTARTPLPAGEFAAIGEVELTHNLAALPS